VASGQDGREEGEENGQWNDKAINERHREKSEGGETERLVECKSKERDEELFGTACVL